MALTRLIKSMAAWLSFSSSVSPRQYCKDCQIMQSIELRGGIERDGVLFVMEGERASQAKTEITQWLQNLSTSSPVIQQLLQKQSAN